MHNIKSQVGKKAFLGIIFVLGGMTIALIRASACQDNSVISSVLFGITAAMLGTYWIFSAMEEHRARKREEQKIKDIKGQ